MWGDWRVVEIESRGNKVPVSEALGMTCITFKEDGTYLSCDESYYFIKGDWMVRGEMLRLHSAKIRDLNGRELDKGHDSEWTIANNTEWMVWRGTSKFNHQHLKLILKRKEN